MGKFAIALDIEGTGARLSAPVVAIGVCVGNVETGEVISTSTWCLKMPLDDKIEAKCMVEFWQKNMELWHEIDRNAIPANQAFREFADYLDAVYEDYGDSLVILSDNPCYDLARLDLGLERFVQRLPVRYSPKGDYTCVCDPSEQMTALPKKIAQEIRENANKLCPATHWPSEDATNIFYQYHFVRKAIGEQSEQSAQSN
jgi:hypothetical protein